MLKWFSELLFGPPPAPKGFLAPKDDWVGFKVKSISGSTKPYYFKPKRSNVSGRRPDDLEENEIAYNTADDEFYVGTGDGYYKTYRSGHSH